MNNELQKIMPGLTAKVFRTYNASEVLQKKLEELKIEKSSSVELKKTMFDSANKEVILYIFPFYKKKQMNEIIIFKKFK